MRPLCAAFAVALLAAPAAAQRPDSSHDCAVCHFSWMPAFLDEERDGELAPQPIGSVVNDEDTCFSCHDGSMVDSRERVYLEHGHRTGIAPPEDMEVPEVLPLDDDGQLHCGTCHTAHGTDESRFDIATAVFLRVGGGNSELCTMCHEDWTREAGARNHPVGVDLDGEWPADLEPTFARQGREADVVCESCHTPHGSERNDLLILPMEDGTLCSACHVDRLAPTQNHALDEPPGPEADHEMLEQLGSRLGEEGEIICLTCHSMHGGAADTGILRVSNEADALCLTCHSEMTRLGETEHALRETAPDLENAGGRPAESAGSCSGCHTPHDALGPMLWARAPAHGEEGESALCLSCHGDVPIDDVTSVGMFTHPTEVDLADGMAAGDLHLFDSDLQPDDDGRVACSTCHAAHGTEDGADALLTADNEGDSLCTQCHGAEEDQVARGLHDLSEMDDVSGPCTACHAPHGGHGPLMWAQEPAGSGTMAERICQACHGDPHWPDATSSDGHLHPVTAVAAELEGAGDLPLYDADEVRASPLGRMTCLTCHDAHHLPRDADVSARYAVGGDSPLCTSCHATQSGVTGGDHNLLDEVEEVAAAFAIDVADEGVCGACHRFQDDGGGAARFRAEIDAEESPDAVEGLCLSCHREQGIAEDHTVPLNSHPRSVMPPEERRPDSLPLFNAAGQRDEEGWISCTTCHDPHAEPREEDEEGHGLFLRQAEGEDAGLCLDCHHGQAIIEGSDHDLRLTAPDAVNDRGQTVADSTVCGACHLAHPPDDRPLLWGHGLGEANEFVAQACLGCHHTDGAGRALPEGARPHPTDPVVLLPAEEAPLYDAGGHPGHAGVISCATCHDAHRWAGEAPTPGEDTEGDVRTSFLRDGVAESICSDCHGREALVRYLLFHHWNRAG